MLVIFTRLFVAAFGRNHDAFASTQDLPQSDSSLNFSEKRPSYTVHKHS
ncbi:MAG: hypothetical protein JWM30_4222 [Burkholderia sp.]|nr:hypothetical protein [Burkholderia sp.]